MKVLIASDKFRGTVSARGVGDAVSAAAKQLGWQAVSMPLADGGEGLLDALGGPNRSLLVSGPLGDPVEAPWRYDRSSRAATIEMAAASGLALVGAENNDPIAATTTGTGELVAAAVELGAKRIVVGVGGSATTDGGFGALRAMFPLQRLRGVELIVACDVRTRFVDCARVFGPQKGASPAQVELLERRLRRLAQVYLDEHGVDVRELSRAGAAGGLGGGLAAAGAALVDGFNYVADELDLFSAIEAADLVITGEGFLDEQSFEGKVVGGVASLAAEAGTEVVAIAGRVFDGVDDRVAAYSLVDTFGEQRALDDTAACITELATTVLSSFAPEA